MTAKRSPFTIQPDHPAWGTPTVDNSAAADTMGYSLVEAASRFARDTSIGRQFIELWWRSQIVGDHPDCLTLTEHEDLMTLQAEVEAGLLAGLRSGRLIARGIAAGRVSPDDIHALWWKRARLDFRQNRAQVDATAMADIEVNVAEPVPANAPSLKSKRRKRFQTTDEKLRVEWEALVKSGMSGWAAAQSLAPKAEGVATLESKTSRLFKRFTLLTY